MTNVIFQPLPPKMVDSRDYNRFLKSAGFWASVQAEKVLLLRTEAVMLRSGLNRFMEFDMIGSLGSKKSFKIGNTSYAMRQIAGNIAFSLRSVKAMHAVCEKYGSGSEDDEPEDIYFARHLPSLGYKVPNQDIVEKFCPTRSFEDPSAMHPLALHAGWLHMPRSDLEIHLNQFHTFLLENSKSHH